MVEVEPGVRARIESHFGMVFWYRDEECQKHGLFEATAVVHRSHDTSQRPARWQSRCPKCVEEDKIEQERLDHEAALKAALEARIEKAGIPTRFQTATLESYVATNAGQRHALRVAHQYADDFVMTWRHGRGLLLLGNIGNGKTHLAVGIAMKAMEQGCRAIFTTAAQMMAQIKATWGQPNSTAEQEALIDRYAYVGLLVLDELGSIKCVGREREIMSRILGARYDEVRPTVFTANLTPHELPEYLGEQIVSRLRESGSEVVGFNWEDYRPTKARTAA